MFKLIDGELEYTVVWHHRTEEQLFLKSSEIPFDTLGTQCGIYAGSPGEKLSEKELISLGKALLSPHDEYDKAIGREVSLKRAMMYSPRFNNNVELRAKAWESYRLMLGAKGESWRNKRACRSDVSCGCGGNCGCSKPVFAIENLPHEVI